MAKTLFKPVSTFLSQLLGDIELGKLALPELQRPFVWQTTAVRDLFDSMYRGFPIGSLMLWSTHEADARYIGTDGKQHTPTEFIVDGQQRLTSLYAVIKGAEVTFHDFKRARITLAFRPRDAQFEVANAATRNDPEYLGDITELWTGNDWEVIGAFIDRLHASRPAALENGQEGALRSSLSRLRNLDDFPIQTVLIGHEVDEELVAEIFLRGNSGGTNLTQADFILTLLSVFREDDRRRLEAFAQSAKLPTHDGTPSPYNHLITPAADQLLRVAVLVAFRRGRLQSVLALLRGAGLDDIESVKPEEREARLDRLSKAISVTLDLTSWHEFLKALMAAGFRRSNEITSANSVVLVYALYLIGREYGLSHSQLRTTIARFFFMAALTGRYTGSFEARITQDVQSFTEADSGEAYLDHLRAAIDTALTSDYWTITLPQYLATSSARSPELFSYAAALCVLNARVPPLAKAGPGNEPKASLFLRDLFDPVVHAKKSAIERHHLFPRKHLENTGIAGIRSINQIANMSYVEWPDNIEVSAQPPAEYWPPLAEQFSATDLFHHALWEDWYELGYEDFLTERRRRMAEVIRAGFGAIGAAPVPNAVVAENGDMTDEFSDSYLRADQPFSNELAIRRLLRRLRGDVLWYEQHMDRKALEVLPEELDPSAVNGLRLLSGPANLTSRTKKALARFQAELEPRGCVCEWRVLSAEQARAMHARVISDSDSTYEIPPLSWILAAGGVDSIRESKMPLDPFELAWTDGVPLSEWPTNS